VLLRLAHLYEVVAPLLSLLSLYILTAFFRMKLTLAVFGTTCCNLFLFVHYLLAVCVTSVRMNYHLLLVLLLTLVFILMLHYNNAEQSNSCFWWA
jgi:hypothetical protein